VTKLVFFGTLAVRFRGVLRLMRLWIVGSHDELAVAVQRQRLQDEVETIAFLVWKGHADIQPVVLLFGRSMIE
jgi:hypothetical protein